MTLRLSVFLPLSLWLSASFVGSAEPSRKPISAKWVLVAKSDLIAKAKLKVPQSVSKESGNKPGWISLEANIEETAKGQNPGQAVPIRYYTKGPEASPPLSLLEQYNEQEVILFLIEDGGSSEVDRFYYFADRTDVVVPFSNEDFLTISSEAANQQEIVRHFDELLPVGKLTATDATVRKLFKNLACKQRQEAAWEELLKLSRQDIPAIVRNMNDLGQIPNFDAYLPNPPGGSEAVAHYGPRRIVEAALLILQFITRLGFRRYESDSEREWLAEINGWRCWCVYNF